MSYFIMRLFGVPDWAASHYYWNYFSAVEASMVVIVGILAKYIH